MDHVYQLLDALSTRAMTVSSDGLRMETDLTSPNTYFRLETTGRTAKIKSPWTGFTYVITSQKTGKVVTTLGSGSVEARLYASEDRDDTVLSQRWQLKSAEDEDGTAHTVLYNDTYRLAVDAALNNVKYSLLYGINAGNSNQQVSVRAVSGQEGVYQYVKFSDFNADSRQLTIKNAYDFTSLDNFYLKYTVLEDGEVVESGNVDLPALAPDASAAITIPYTTEAGQGETMLNVEVCQKEESLVTEAGYAVASAQFTIQERSATLPEVEVAGTDPVLAITQEGEKTVVSNEKVRLTFASDGQLEGWTADDVQIIADNGGPEYANYRWIENDEHYGAADNYPMSNGITRHSMTSSLSADKKAATVSVTGTGSYCNYVFDYTIYANGIVDLKATYTVTGSNLRRIGMGIEFPGEYSYVSYYARGPLGQLYRPPGGQLPRALHHDCRRHARALGTPAVDGQPPGSA